MAGGSGVHAQGYGGTEEGRVTSAMPGGEGTVWNSSQRITQVNILQRTKELMAGEQEEHP